MRTNDMLSHEKDRLLGFSEYIDETVGFIRASLKEKGANNLTLDYEVNLALRVIDRAQRLIGELLETRGDTHLKERYRLQELEMEKLDTSFLKKPDIEHEV